MTHFSRLALVHPGEPDPDSYYIAGVQRGDEAVFEQLVRRYLGALTRFAYGSLGDEELAHDIVQDVFARIWNLGSDWNPRGSVAAYLFVAVRNRARNAIATRRVQDRLHAVLELELEDASHDDSFVDVALVGLVRWELAQLTERQRDALRLRYEQGLTIASVANVLGVDERAAKRLIARGLSTLRERLEQARGEFE